MPILLREDAQAPLPKLYPVRQSFAKEQLEDVAGAVARELSKPEITAKLKPGQRVAVAVGSRGIKNLAVIVRGVVDAIKRSGAEPFIVSAMGSHGGGTQEGQREILTGYGITEEAMGVPVCTKTEVVELGKTRNGIPVYFDQVAYEADLVVPINRVKLHTDFVDEIQSGLCKMLVIGLGNHRGCTSIHEEEFCHFGSIIQEAATLIMQRAHIGFGVAILENAYDQTALVEAIPRENLLRREIELVQIAKRNMPTLMIPEIDLLIVEQIGKNISGAGYDPNILGKSYILHEFVLPVPKINRMVLLDLSPESHGNGIGMGIFDVITKKVFDQLDYESIYANSVAVKCLDDCKIPLVAADEAEAVRIAMKVLRGADCRHLRVVKIKNTLELERIEVSEALLEVVRSDAQLALLPCEAPHFSMNTGEPG